MKKLLGVVVLYLLLCGNAIADKKNSFADTLRNKINTIDDAWWNNNNLSVSIEVNGTWSGADTYHLAELICGSLKSKSPCLVTISDYGLSLNEDDCCLMKVAIGWQQI